MLESLKIGFKIKVFVNSACSGHRANFGRKPASVQFCHQSIIAFSEEAKLASRIEDAMKLTNGAIAAVFFVSACAQTYQPIVDLRDTDRGKYESDLSDCRQYAEQIDPAKQAVGDAIVSAAFGAALLAALSAIGGGAAGTSAATGAAGGAIIGSAVSAAGGIADQKKVINNCLRGRGYSVLR